MTALVTQTVRQALINADYRSVSNTFGAAVVVLLVLLLVGRELVRIVGGPAAAQRLRALAIVTVPLFITFIIVEAARFAYVIR
jgi:hypothetical protein